MKNKEKESVDFYSSAFLMASGEELINTYRRGTQTVFVFAESENTEYLLTKYFSMQATINASNYAQSIKSLKSIIHGNRISNNQITNYENRKDRV